MFNVVKMLENDEPRACTTVSCRWDLLNSVSVVTTDEKGKFLLRILCRSGESKIPSSKSKERTKKASTALC